MKEFLLNLTMSGFLRRKRPAYMIAYLGVLMALSVIANTLLEFSLFDIQFSVTITFSAFIGYVAGPLAGFAICLFGDLLGVIVKGYTYMFWVGLSTGMFAFIAGLFSMERTNGTLFGYIKVALFALVSFMACTIMINSLGFYIYNMNLGFSKAVRDYISQVFGGEEVTFLGYVFYRLLFKMQIVNSAFNYVLIFIGYTLFTRIPALRKLISD